MPEPSKVAALYPFHGPGKTSAARVFAAALNCLSPEIEKSCGLYRDCVLFLSGRFKVYIVDDGHLLRGETWAALFDKQEERSDTSSEMGELMNNLTKKKKMIKFGVTKKKREKKKKRKFEDGIEEEEKEENLNAELLVMPRKLPMTGTPIQNNLTELWALMHFCMPLIIGTLEQFLYDFKEAGDPSSGQGAQKVKEQFKILKYGLGAFMLHRTKSKLIESRTLLLPPISDTHPSTPFIFLISTQAEGVELNLVAADTVIFYEQDWNPQVDMQALQRAHRIGQSNHVLSINLVAGHTVEEVIMRRARIRDGNFRTSALRTRLFGGGGI